MFDHSRPAQHCTLRRLPRIPLTAQLTPAYHEIYKTSIENLLKKKQHPGVWYSWMFESRRGSVEEVNRPWCYPHRCRAHLLADRPACGRRVEGHLCVASRPNYKSISYDAYRKYL